MGAGTPHTNTLGLYLSLARALGRLALSAPLPHSSYARTEERGELPYTPASFAHLWRLQDPSKSNMHACK
jgi:hypothetical protein